MTEDQGGKVDYYVVHVLCPTDESRLPYMAECNDIIEALNMTFSEGEAFKAVWRKAAQRTIGKGKAGNTAIRDADKAMFYGTRMSIIERVYAGRNT